MLRPLLLAITVSTFLSSALNAQPFDSPQSAPEIANPPEQTCVSIRRRHQTIMVGQGKSRIEVSLGGGACEPPGSGISDLWARFPTDDSELDAVIAKSCPAYQTQINQLWLNRRHQVDPAKPYRDARAGSFVISGRNDLFDLESSEGRRSARHWIRQTLEEVRPCWNNFRDDRTRHVVDRLYRMLAMSAR